MKRLAIALLAFGCTTGTGPDWRVFGAERFTPRDRYRVEYESVEACVGRPGSYQAVRWFYVDSIHYQGIRPYGLWAWPHDIYLLRFHSWELVRHEAVHDVTQSGEHPSDLFPRCETGFG